MNLIYCPFCENADQENLHTRIEFDYGFVYCHCCGVKVQFELYPPGITVEELWNTRPGKQGEEE